MTRKLTFFQSDSFVGLETRRELETKYAPQVFLGSILGTRLSAVGHFFSRPYKRSQKSLRKLTLPSSFLVLYRGNVRVPLTSCLCQCPALLLFILLLTVLPFFGTGKSWRLSTNQSLKDLNTLILC